MDLPSILQNRHYTLIDVREPYEFEAIHAKEAINIPLGSLPAKLNEIREMTGTIVAYCQSGNRSGKAINYLEAQGITDVYNGGSINAVLQHFQMA